VVAQKKAHSNILGKYLRKLKGAQSQFAHIGKLSLNFLNLLFVIHVNLLHP